MPFFDEFQQRPDLDLKRHVDDGIKPAGYLPRSHRYGKRPDQLHPDFAEQKQYVHHLNGANVQLLHLPHAFDEPDNVLVPVSHYLNVVDHKQTPEYHV
ncbi:Uncharacterised protein [Acinetobacter baumannii]|nr:Uncharacterised protein [Acinetobacter baumannii]SSS47361.1 Uncharacterised protein [Acinetobacter baumannii]SSU65568.1 Uncharacterised protein [Acinetobacter baumannii]